VVADFDVGVDEFEWLLQPTADAPASVVTMTTPVITVRGTLIAPCSLHPGTGNRNPAQIAPSANHEVHRSPTAGFTNAVCGPPTVFVRQTPGSN
jgi:hypothetical protein